MAVEDGYNVERSLLGENNANNEQDSSLVTANSDGSAVERLEALKVQLAAIASTDLSAAITAIEGSGFATGVDSLKIISDVLDTIKDYVDTVETAQTAIKGAAFDTATDSLKVLSDVLDVIDGYHDVTVAADSVANAQIRDVIGKKDDTVAGNSIVALAKQVIATIGTLANAGGTATIGAILGDFANVTLVTKLANLQAEVDKITTPTSAVKRIAGKTQLFTKNITNAANAGLVTIGTVTDQSCLIKSIALISNGATTVDLTSAAIKGGASQSVEFISAVTAAKANIDTEDEQVSFSGAKKLKATKTIVIDLQGTGATAIDFTICVEYCSVADGGYIV